VSKQHGATTFYHIKFCNDNDGVLKLPKIMTKTGQEMATGKMRMCGHADLRILELVQVRIMDLD